MNGADSGSVSQRTSDQTIENGSHLAESANAPTRDPRLKQLDPQDDASWNERSLGDLMFRRPSRTLLPGIGVATAVLVGVLVAGILAAGLIGFSVTGDDPGRSQQVLRIAGHAGDQRRPPARHRRPARAAPPRPRNHGRAARRHRAAPPAIVDVPAPAQPRPSPPQPPPPPPPARAAPPPPVSAPAPAPPGPLEPLGSGVNKTTDDLADVVREVTDKLGQDVAPLSPALGGVLAQVGDALGDVVQGTGSALGRALGHR
jgi:hypothetical protein